MTKIELRTAQYLEDKHDPNDFAIKIKNAEWTPGLTILGFTCILIGIWGLGTAALGVSNAAQATGRAKIDHTQTDYRQIQNLQTVAKVAKEFRTANIFFYIAKFCLSIALLAGSGMLLMRLPFARRMMVRICGAAIGFHVLGAALGLAMFIQVSGQIEDSSRASLMSLAGNMENADAVISQYMNGVAFGALVGTFLGMLIKGGVYVRMILYLGQPLPRAVFGEDPHPEYDDVQQNMYAQSPA